MIKDKVKLILRTFEKNKIYLLQLLSFLMCIAPEGGNTHTFLFKKTKKYCSKLTKLKLVRNIRR